MPTLSKTACGKPRLPRKARTARQRKAGSPTAPPPIRPDDEDYDYERCSTLAGPLTDPDPHEPYRVRYRTLCTRKKSHLLATLTMASAAPLLAALLLMWLLLPAHTARRSGVTVWLQACDTVLLCAMAAIELFRLVNVVSNAHATLAARDPVPVHPRPGMKVAFVTTYVPGKEPLAMLRATLEGALATRHDGTKDVWLLDEGDDDAARELCARLGVHHFSRKGHEEWNRPTGKFRARTKHGNYNAWLTAHGARYDVMASVDTDHVPLPHFLERMLGYFRDPDVAFVVGPQAYGNYEGPVTKAAESQQYLFHAVVQRAGNAHRSAMFVGTNNCVRLAALCQIGGLCDSITEDLATGLELHRHRNPATGRHWTSVYTPDLLAVGEGPATWTDYFTQQLRWSRGTYEALLKQFPRAVATLPPGRSLNYALLAAYYPLAALSWILVGVCCLLYLGLGATGSISSPSIWLMLYTDATALQVGLFLWNRRHNVSPHEPKGSAGVAGMAMSILCAPVYARSLTDALLRRTSRFVVTPKGTASSTDTLRTFRTHLKWTALFGGSLATALYLGTGMSLMHAWAVLALAVTLAPAAMWAMGVQQEKRAASPGTAPVTSESA